MLDNFIMINDISIFNYLSSKIKYFLKEDSLAMAAIIFDIKKSTFTIYAMKNDPYKFLSFRLETKCFEDKGMKKACARNYENISECIFEIYKILSSKSIVLIQEGILE